MSEAISATYDARDPGIRAGTAQSAAIHSIHEAKTDRQVREDKPFYVPDFLSGGEYDDNPEAYDAAVKNARHLRKAQRDVSDGLNLVGLMASAIVEDGDSRAVQIEAGLKSAERRLRKALDRLDRHCAHHDKLFLAYFKLKHETNGDEA